MAHILVVDDEPKLGALAAEILIIDGHQVERALGGREAINEIIRRPFDIVLTDLKMPDVDGMAVLQAARSLQPVPEVLLMTAYGTAESAVAAMKAGAADYIIKPFSMDELRLRVRRLAEQRLAEGRSARLAEQLKPKIVAESDAMKRVVEEVHRISSMGTTVLLSGDSGTGKSQIARLIHYSGKRSTGPLLEVHCGALPAPMLEAELFGQDTSKPGHLASAEGGTIVLDGVAEISPAIQARLLRFVQEREVESFGGRPPRKIDARLITTTNVDLAAALSSGQLRQDFYYRLNVFQITIPPLRTRREDILPLADLFLARHALPPEKLGKPARGWLLEQDWPGNARELENTIERAIILSGDSTIAQMHLVPARPVLSVSAGTFQPSDVLVDGFNLDIFERDLIFAAIDRERGNKAAAARLLGITRRRLYSRIQSLEDRVGEPEET